MTPREFVAAYLPYARNARVACGLDETTLFAQWALETAWATAWAGAPNNLSNIRPYSDGTCAAGGSASGGFCHYPSLDAFVTANNLILHQTNMAVILNSASQPILDQLTALGVSPWDAGHYEISSGAAPGSALIPY